MARIANTFTTSDAGVNREELSGIVDRVRREDTPLYSMISKGACDSIYPTWPQDSMEAPGENAQLEGDEFVFDDIDPASRVGNPTQIFEKSFVMSMTQDRVDNAGQTEQYNRFKLTKGIELRRDVEFAILSNVASERSDLPRHLGGLPTWITTNVSRGVNGVNGGFQTSDGETDVAVNGDQRALTKALVDTVMAAAYSTGANIDTIMMAPYVKRVFTTFQTDSNVAQFTYEAPERGGSTLVSNVTKYNGDFGTVTVVPNAVMATAALSRNVFLLDTDKLSFLWLRKIHEVTDLAKTGDNRKHVVLGEGTLKVSNEAGLGVVADVFGLTAST
jgi:hypothetical protein